MKNRFLAAVAIAVVLGGSNLSASSEEATLTDIKESLSYLIGEYSKLTKLSDTQKQTIETLSTKQQNDANASNKKASELITLTDKNRETIQENKKAITLLEKKLDELMKKISFRDDLVPAKSKYDKTIKDFVNKNLKNK